MSKKLTIGVSTGWLFAQGIFTIAKQNQILKSAGADAVEFNFTSKKRGDSLINGERFDSKYNSLHFSKPSEDLPIQELIRLTMRILSSQKINMGVLHYTDFSEPELEELLKTNIFLSVENLDKAGIKENELEILEKIIEKHNLGFVLDVQHAYEQDSSMKYAEELFKTFRHRLKRIHISGETPTKIHELVHKADNRKAIIEFTKEILKQKNVPMIIEGKYETEEDIKNEIKFLREELI